jgi:hypothetical protein
MDELLLLGLSMLRKARLLSQKPGFYQPNYSPLMLELRKKSIRALLEIRHSEVPGTLDTKSSRGRRLTAPSHTTVRTGPYTAVRQAARSW